MAKNNESTFPTLGDLDDFLTKHNSNFIWLLAGKSGHWGGAEVEGGGGERGRVSGGVRGGGTPVII